MTFVRTLGTPSTSFGEKVAAATARFASKQKIRRVQEGVTANGYPSSSTANLTSQYPSTLNHEAIIGNFVSGKVLT